MPPLAAALESALALGRSPATQPSEAYPGLEHVVLEADLSVEEFAARLRTVPGWDVVIVIHPYGSGQDIDLDGAGLHGFWLRRRIAGLEGWPNEGIYVASVIRADEVVGQFFVH